MTSIIRDFTKMVAQFELDHNEWDDPPVFFLVGQGDDGVLTQNIVSLGMTDQPLPATLWVIGEGLIHPPEGGPAMPPLENLIGIVLRYEGWGMEMDEANREELQAFLDNGGRIADHPSGVETMGVMGIDDDGVYSMGFNRGDAEVWDFGPGSPTGLLIDGLRHMYEGFSLRSTRS